MNRAHESGAAWVPVTKPAISRYGAAWPLLVLIMDPKLLLARLAQAERDVLEGAKYVADQTALVSKHERDGRNATHARQLLAHLEAMQALHVAERDRLKRELAANDN